LLTTESDSSKYHCAHVIVYDVVKRQSMLT
jgi:hypothetical protein